MMANLPAGKQGLQWEYEWPNFRKALKRYKPFYENAIFPDNDLSWTPDCILLEKVKTNYSHSVVGRLSTGVQNGKLSFAVSPCRALQGVDISY